MAKIRTQDFVMQGVGVGSWLAGWLADSLPGCVAASVLVLCRTLYNIPILMLYAKILYCVPECVRYRLFDLIKIKMGMGVWWVVGGWCVVR